MLAFHWAVFGAVFVVSTISTIFFVKTLLDWCYLNLAGAGRKVFVGTHGRKNEGVVKPDPRFGHEETTVLISPLVRPDALVDPDRDNVTIKVPFAAEGAPASAKDDQDKCLALFRVAWSISDWVPFVDVEGDPGDHGRLPQNLKVPVEEMDPTIHRRFVARGWEDFFGRITHYLPAAAVIAYMSKYTEGEHLSHLYFFLAKHIRELLGAMETTDLMRIRNPKDATMQQRLPYQSTIIRGTLVRWPVNWAKPYYINTKFANIGQLQRVISSVLTWIGQLELEPYGVFVNDVTLLDVKFPQRLIDASRELEAKRHELLGMDYFTDRMAANVKKLVEQTGMDPNVAGGFVSAGAEEGSLLAALVAGLKFLKG